MSAATATRDYGLGGAENSRAVAVGLANAEWYRTPIPRKRMKELMQRSDGPAIRDTAHLVRLVSGRPAGSASISGAAGGRVPFFIAYGVLYGSSSDSRWHECGHGTAFKTRWMNDVVYQIACFMIMREPTVWRWSHTRHHTDTIIVGRDPEIAAMRPPRPVQGSSSTSSGSSTHAGRDQDAWSCNAAGRLSAEEADLHPGDGARARSIASPGSGSPSMPRSSALAIAIGLDPAGCARRACRPCTAPGYHLLTGLTQHAGLAEDVLDHRLNCRTVYMNPVSASSTGT